MNKVIIKGIVEVDDEDDIDVIYINDEELRDILINELEKLFNISIDYDTDELYIENAHVSLFVANKEMPFDKMKESKVLSDLGLSFNIDYEGYSEYTVDYFYIDKLTIGNHNLLDILRTMNDNYIVLTIENIKK